MVFAGITLGWKFEVINFAQGPKGVKLINVFW